MRYYSSSAFTIIHKLFLVIIASTFLFATCLKTNKQKEKQPLTNAKRDSLKKILDTTIVHYQTKIREILDTIYITDSSHADSSYSTMPGFYVIQSGNDKTEEGWLEMVKQSIPWFISVLSLFVAYFGFMRNSRFKNYDFLSEVNKQLMANPELNAFYDTRKKDYESEIEIKADGKPCEIALPENETIYFKSAITLKALQDNVEITGNTSIKRDDGSDYLLGSLQKDNEIKLVTAAGYQPLMIKGNALIVNHTGIKLQGISDKKLKDKLRSFSYYKLNNFESVLQNYKNVKWGEGYKTWQRYLIDTFMTSGVFRDTVNQAIDGKLFSREFTILLEVYKGIYEDLKALYPHGDKNRIAAYNTEYNRVIKSIPSKKKVIEKKYKLSER